MRWPLLASEHVSSLSLTTFHSFLPCGFIVIIIILSVFGPCAQCHDGMSEQKEKQTNKINRCCRCYGDGGQIHGRVWEGIQRP